MATSKQAWKYIHRHMHNVVSLVWSLFRLTPITVGHDCWTKMYSWNTRRCTAEPNNCNCLHESHDGQSYLLILHTCITYRICLIRHRGYYLFHHAMLCGFYSRAATIQERRLLNSVFSVKFFVIIRALRKGSFIRRIAMQLDQPPLCYKAVYLHGTSNPFPHFLPMISHDDHPPCLKKCRTPLDSVHSCTYRVLLWYCHSSPRFVHVHMCYSNISRS